MRAFFIFLLLRPFPEGAKTFSFGMTCPSLRSVTLGLSLALASLPLLACGSDASGGQNDAPGSQPATAESRGELAPDTRFATLDGGTASIGDFRGSVLVVNFWGTWCVPCRREIPELVELADRYEDRPVEIIGIAVDSGEPEDIREFADGFGVQYHLWMTDMATALADFESVGYPFTLIIDREGRVVETFYGPQTLESLAGKLDALLD